MEKHIIQKLLEETDDFPPQSYSGRFMYGAKCLGVQCHSETQLFSFLLSQLAEQPSNIHEIRDALDELSRALENAKSDSLGLGRIVYFPNVEFVEEDLEEL